MTDEHLQPDHQLSDEQADEYSHPPNLHAVDADDSCVDLLLDNERLHDVVRSSDVNSECMQNSPQAQNE